MSTLQLIYSYSCYFRIIYQPKGLLYAKMYMWNTHLRCITEMKEAGGKYVMFVGITCYLAH